MAVRPGPLIKNAIKYTPEFVHVCAALGQLKEDLRDARLVQLQPWAQFAQHSGVVLMKGLLQTSGRSSHRPRPSNTSPDWEQVSACC